MTIVSCGACGTKASGAQFAEQTVRQAWFQAHKRNCNRRTVQRGKGAEPRENVERRERSSAVSPRVVPKPKEITSTGMSDAERTSRTGKNVLRFEERWSRAEKRDEKQDAANKLAEARKEHAGWLRIRDVSPYGARNIEHSFFVDWVLAQRGDELALERVERERSYQQRPEVRAVTTGVLGGLVPGSAGLPAWTAEAVAEAARTAAPLAHALMNVPLPDEGVYVPVGQFTAGTAATEQTAESAAVSDSSPAPAVAFELEKFTTLTARVDTSFQALERGGNAVDLQLSTDISAAIASQLESRLWSGSGSSGQILGLINASNTAGTRTIATQNLADHLSKIGGAVSDVATTLGQEPDLVAMASRRAAWLRAQSQNEQLEDLLAGMQLIASPAAPVTLGASTNQDYIVVLNRQAVPLFIGEVSIEVQNLGGSATAMKASVIARQYAALGTGRRPQGIALVQGAVAPAF